MTTRLAASLALLLTASLGASSMDDLKASLAKLQGQGALRGTYQVNAWSRGGKGKDLQETKGTASAWVEEDASGLRIQWDRSLLQRAEAEAGSSKGPKKAGSPILGIESASVLKIYGAMNYAPKLARLLASGQLKRERSDVFQSQPARLLEVQLPPPDADDEDKPKESTYTAKIWLDPEGLPLGATLVHTLKASLLFISAVQSMTEELAFSRVADRLVVVRREESQSGKGMGFELQTRTISTFTIK